MLGIKLIFILPIKKNSNQINLNAINNFMREDATTCKSLSVFYIQISIIKPYKVL